VLSDRVNAPVAAHLNSRQACWTPAGIQFTNPGGMKSWVDHYSFLFQDGLSIHRQLSKW